MRAIHCVKKSGVWTKELGLILLDGIEDNREGKERARERIKALHPPPQGKDRYPQDFEKWLTKVFERPSEGGLPPWLSSEFWQEEVDKVLIQGIFLPNANDEVVHRIHSVWPRLSTSWLGARMQEVARIGLPGWMDPTFWTMEVDPILLSGIQNASECQHEAVDMVLRAFPRLDVGMIWNRLRRLRRKRTEKLHARFPEPAAANANHLLGTQADCKADSSAVPHVPFELPARMDQSFWRTAVDPILLSGIRNANRLERETVDRVLRKFSELRISTIWARLRRLAEQRKEDGPAVRWTDELDKQLTYIHQEAGLSAAVSGVRSLTGWPRRAILRRAHKLGLPARPLGSRRPWTLVEFRFVIESLNHMSVKEIADELERSEKAVWNVLGHRGIPARFEDGHSVRELAAKLHVRRPSIRTWIKADLLHKKRNGRISEDSLQTFLYNHPERINWSLLDEDTTFWVSELLEAERTRVSGSRARTPANSRSSEETPGAETSNSHGTASNTLAAAPCEDPASHHNRARAASPRR